MAALLALYMTMQSTVGQFGDNCEWGDFNLQGILGYEIQCIAGSANYAYTPCMSYALCNGSRYQAVHFNRNTGICEYYLAEWDEGATIPQYSMNDDINQWTFNYDNGQTISECPTGVEFEIIWICDPIAYPYSLTVECGQINACKHSMTIRSALACTDPPPNNDCIWDSFSLQEVKGYEVSCLSGESSYAYSPCFDFVLCNGDKYQAIYFNRTVGECEYYLSQWDNGALSPVYFNDGGNPLWQFNYKNGEETTECPKGVEFEINWICNEECSPYCLDSKCNQVNECRHQMAIESVYACIIPGKSQNKTGVTKLLALQKQLRFDGK